MKFKAYTPPSSKSVCHRAMICAAYANGESILDNVNFCDDTLATCEGLQRLGAKITIDRAEKRMRILGGDFPKAPSGEIACKDSASTLRLLIPQVLSLDSHCLFTGSEGLAKRPLDAYYTFFKEQGISYATAREDRCLPLTLKGRLAAGSYEISIAKSSQFASGLMLYLGSKAAPSSLTLTGGMESLDYIRLSAQVMQSFGVDASLTERTIRIQGEGYKPAKLTMEGDYSQASYFIALGLLHKGIIIKGLHKDSLQADRKMIEFVQRMGGNLEQTDEGILVRPGRLKACNIDVSDCPDLAPTLAALMSVAEGNSELAGCRRLVYKESDRLHRTAAELNKLGASVRVAGDRMLIAGAPALRGGKVSAHGDHRLAMALSILQPASSGRILLDDPTCVGKSYPDFFKDLGDYYE